MSGIVRQYFSHAFHAGHVRRVAGEAFDLDDLALAAQFLSQPASRGLGPFFLVDTDVVHAGDVQFLVDRDDEDALVQGFLQGGVQAAHIAGVHQDGIHALGHQVLQLLNLTGDVRVGAFDYQLVGDAGIHVFLVGIDQFLDHLRAVFAADEGIRDADGEFIVSGRFRGWLFDSRLFDSRLFSSGSSATGSSTAGASVGAVVGAAQAAKSSEKMVVKTTNNIIDFFIIFFS